MFRISTILPDAAEWPERKLRPSVFREERSGPDECVRIRSGRVLKADKSGGPPNRLTAPKLSLMRCAMSQKGPGGRHGLSESFKNLLRKAGLDLQPVQR